MSACAETANVIVTSDHELASKGVAICIGHMMGDYFRRLPDADPIEIKMTTRYGDEIPYVVRRVE